MLVATGTPLENHLGELCNLFGFINPGLLGSQESFASRKRDLADSLLEGGEMSAKLDADALLKLLKG